MHVYHTKWQYRARGSTGHIVYLLSVIISQIEAPKPTSASLV